jgi:NAD(P)-dependent dehydrogenase (short-subunit alcohol dehydrogenase family)
MSERKRFEGRRALVTGSSRGIGAAIAERLARDGAAVAITARTLDHHPKLAGSLTATAARLRALGADVTVVVADLSDEDDRSRIVPEAEAGLGGPVDILVNNAAVAIYNPLLEMPLRRRRITFEVNVHAPLDLAQAVLPAMVARREGWILNLSSVTVLRAPSRMAVYGASKAALNRMTLGLAEEVAGTGVRVNTVQPRAAVMSEGAEMLVGGTVPAANIESMEQMVEAAVALCDCEPELTGRICVSLDLLAERGLSVPGAAGGA